MPFTSNRNNSFLFTVTFEDKRKDNFEKGRLELERRRMELQEKLKKEKDERERKEALEEERRQRAKLEAEQKRQAELEKQRQQQLEMEREQEALRKKMIQQRLVRKCFCTPVYCSYCHYIVLHTCIRLCYICVPNRDFQTLVLGLQY